MKLKTAVVEIAGITCQPNEMWMTQLARNLLDPCDGFLRGVRSFVDGIRSTRLAAGITGVPAFEGRLC